MSIKIILTPRAKPSFLEKLICFFGHSGKMVLSIPQKGTIEIMGVK